MTGKFGSILQSHNCYVCLHFLSFALFYLPNGVAWYWGNLVVYLNSYWLANFHNLNFQTPWFLSIFVVCWSMSLTVGGYIITRHDRRYVIATGLILFDGGIFLSYFSTMYSSAALNVTLGVLPGLGLGLIQTSILTKIPLLMRKKLGMGFAMLNNFNNGGASLLTSAITWYANPSNLEADLPTGLTKLFRHKSVIERVPSIFLVLGIATFALHFSGFALSLLLDRVYSSHRLDNCQLNVIPDDGKERKGETTPINQGDGYYNNVVDKQIIVDKIIQPTEKQRCISDVQTLKGEKFSLETDLNPDKETTSHKSFTDLEKSEKAKGCAVGVRDLGPRQLLKTLSFYVLWYTVFATDLSFIIMLNFYKIFGELWIRDDHFLTNLSIASLFAVIISRFFWAVIIDRYSVATIQVILTLSMSVTLFFYSLTPQVSPYLFAVWTCIIITLCASVYLSFQVATLKLFGETHFGSNYGLVATSTIVLNVMAPLTLNGVMQRFGWHAIFMGTGALNALALVANIVTLPKRLQA